MGMSIDDYEYELAEQRDKCINYKKQGCCEYTDCNECDYLIVCDEWESEY